MGRIDIKAPRPQPHGVGGWLLVFLVYILAEIGLVGMSLAYQTAASAAYQGSTFITTVGIGMQTLFLLGAALGLLKMLGTSPSVPRYWVVFLGMVAAGCVVVLLAAALIQAPPEFMTMVGALLGSAGTWMAYWSLSRRVDNTYRWDPSRAIHLPVTTATPGTVGVRVCPQCNARVSSLACFCERCNSPLV